MNNFELRSKKLQESQDALEQKILRQRNFIINKFCKESYGKEAEGGDEILYKKFTDDEKKELDEFWSRLSFLYKADYDSIEPFYNISGIFDKRYIPYEFMENYLRPQFYKEAYRAAFQDKTYLGQLFSDIKQPRVIVRKVEGLYYNEKFENISLENAINDAYNYSRSGKEMLIKPNLSTMGMGIKFLSTPSLPELRIDFINYGNFVIQEAIKQHEQMAYLNKDTVNTVRITTFLLKENVIPLAALIRVGAPNKRVDNWHQGGSILGINLDDGSTLPWALGNHIEKITTLPSGAVIGKSGFKKVPHFDKVVNLVKKAHYRVPMFKMISWDIAIEESGEPVMLEFNVFGDITIHEMLTGPLFGEYTDQIINQYVLQKQSKKGVTENFDFAEFEKHIKITKYYGDEKKVVIPDSINNKPVVTIGIRSFLNQSEIEEVVLPKTVKVIQTEAFKGCKKLKKIVGDFNNISYARSAFNGCDSL